jgi:hypothetical protein
MQFSNSTEGGAGRSRQGRQIHIQVMYIIQGKMTIRKDLCPFYDEKDPIQSVCHQMDV